MVYALSSRYPRPRRARRRNPAAKSATVVLGGAAGFALSLARVDQALPAELSPGIRQMLTQVVLPGVAGAAVAMLLEKRDFDAAMLSAFSAIAGHALGTAARTVQAEPPLLGTTG